MNIITGPTVHLLSLPRFFPTPGYELPKGGNELENIIATGGKICYDTFGHDVNPVQQHVLNLVKQAHGSVLEHVNIGVVIVGVSRGLSHEAVRHRHFSYSQRSTRYTAEEEASMVLDPYYASLYKRQLAQYDAEAHGAEVLDPLSDDERQLLDTFIAAAEDGFEAYRRQLPLLMKLNPEGLSGRDLRKWARGKARQLLPHALETRLVVTGNIRAWRHFFNMRSGRGAEAEIRRLAHVMWPVIAGNIMAAFNDVVVEHHQGYDIFNLPSI